ncbi:MAG: hypothetical protein CL840_22215 [Crocinitomicaceae bacterium]|nr:hypothetical protein [Crocinitomicaceae bacterium]
MNHELFIAHKIINSRSKGGAINRGTRIILNIAILGICLGLAIMLVAVSTVTGFQREIQSRVVGFGSHVQITEFNFDDPLNFQPIDKKQPFYPLMDTIPEVRNLQIFALKEGIVKGEDEIYGVISKGISTDFDWEFFANNMVEGRPIMLSDSSKSKEAVISKTIAQKLNLKLNDPLLVYFIHDGKSRPRKFTISGIYHTGMEQFDKAYILVDIKHLQKINGWDENQVSGFEVLLHRYEDLFRMDEFLYRYIPPELNTISIVSQYPEIFGWLELQDMNVIVIIILMILVCGINMISALLILILEKINMIGILKSMGAQNGSIRTIFLYMASYLVTWGLFWGNLIGLSFLYIQDKYHLLKLDQSSYYIDHVPVNINFYHLVLINVGTLFFCVLFLVLPSYLVTKISPVKAVRFN